MKKLRPSFAESSQGNSYYSIREDWALIESSFAAQYGIKRKELATMSFDEFTTLLSGILPDTPLGQIVSIRAESDSDTIRRFNDTQRKIYNDWQNRIISKKSKDLKEKELENLINMMSKMFG